MADVRSLLRNERASRRIIHPNASYSESGKLLCNICNVQIKTESLWENHIKTPQHSLRREHARANPPPAQGKKRKAEDSSRDDRKRVKDVPDGFVPEGFFETDAPEGIQDVDVGPVAPPDHEEEPASELPASAPAPAPAPEIDLDEWAAFERDIAAADQPPMTAINAINNSATISAAPVTAEDLAAQAREEQSTQRGAREAEIEADNEDAARALEDEFEEMEGLDERVRKLREKREALRLAATLSDVPSQDAPTQTLQHPPQDQQDDRDNDDDDDDDDDADEFDDWNFGAR